MWILMHLEYFLALTKTYIQNLSGKDLRYSSTMHCPFPNLFVLSIQRKSLMHSEQFFEVEETLTVR